VFKTTEDETSLNHIQRALSLKMK